MAKAVRRPDERPPFRFRWNHQTAPIGRGIVMLAIAMTFAQLAALLRVVRMRSVVSSNSTHEHLAESAPVFVDIAPTFSPHTRSWETGVKHRPIRIKESARSSRRPSDATTAAVPETTSDYADGAGLRGNALLPSKEPTAARVRATCARGPCMSNERSGVSAPYAGETRSDVSMRWTVMRAIKNSPKLPPTDAELRSAAFVARYSPRTVMIGGGVNIGLWGGGPSAAQRRRDSTINTANKVVFIRVKARADSAVAARRDSILRRQARDSMPDQVR